ncbi:hypothetical protein ACTFIY_004947 [Dictyostelium cf. discoideum]
MNSVVKKKREYEEEQKQKGNLNSFSKIIKFTITDNIEASGEILFWKLFRNKVIYKNIFSFMDNRFSINYDSMSSIKNLIDNNKINILKEKVYRNCRYLYFNSNYYGLEPALFFVKLFSKIKDDDYKFYRNFFNGDNCYYNSYSDISTALILSKNLKIFKLYINEFNYKPTDYYKPIMNKNPYNIGNGLEFNERSTLKTLITICKLILLLKKSIENEITLIKDDLKTKKETLRHSFKSITTTTTTITIQEIDNFIIEKIDKQTLKSILEDPINYNNKEVKFFIKKLLNLYQSTFKYTNRFIFINDIVGNKYKAAFKFGNLKLLQDLVDLSYYRLLPKNLGNFNNNPHLQNSPYTENFIVLFSHCFDREKKIKFIDQLIERNIKKQELDFQNHFFYMLIMHGDIELLKYFSNKVGTTLDFFIDLQFPKGYCTFFKSLQFLQHFESLLIQYKSNNPSIIEKDPISFLTYNFDYKRNDDYLELIYHFATNSLYNNHDRNECFYLLSTHSKNYKTNQIQHFPTPLEIKGTFSMKYLKFVDLAFTDNYHELEILNRYDLDENSNHHTINFYYDLEHVYFIFRLSLIDLVNSRTPYLYELNNFKFLNWFLTKIKNYYYSSNKTSTRKSKIKLILHEFMIKNISNSRLKVLEYIHQNFDFILKKESDGGILTSDDLTSYLNSTISKDYFNEKLKLYFLNKLNK